MSVRVRVRVPVRAYARALAESSCVQDPDAKRKDKSLVCLLIPFLSLDPLQWSIHVTSKRGYLGTQTEKKALTQRCDPRCLQGSFGPTIRGGSVGART